MEGIICFFNLFRELDRELYTDGDFYSCFFTTFNSCFWGKIRFMITVKPPLITKLFSLIFLIFSLVYWVNNLIQSICGRILFLINLECYIFLNDFLYI